MNNVDVIARKEFNDAIRSYVLIAVTSLFFLLTLLLTGIYASIDFFGDANPTIEGMIGFATSGATVFVPLIAIVLTYKSIVGERTSGSLALTLSLPNTRQDVFFGKFVGRSAILLVAIGAAFLAGLLVTAVQIGLGGISQFVLYILMISLLGLVYVAVGLALSGATNSSILAAVGSITVFGLFRFAWTWIWFFINSLINRLVNGTWLPPNPQDFPGWLKFVLMVNPHNAYGLVVDEYIYGESTGLARSIITQGDAFYATPGFGLVFVFLWIAVPLALGLYRFETVDL